MIRLAQEIVIDCPLTDVFAFIADPRHDPAWNDPIRLAELTSPAPVTRGTTFRFITEFMGRQLELSGEITAYEPNQRVCVRTVSGPLRSQGCRTVSAVPGGTRLSIAIEGEALGLLRLAEAAAALAVRHQLSESLVQLKRLLERRAEH